MEDQSGLMGLWIEAFIRLDFTLGWRITGFLPEMTPRESNEQRNNAWDGLLGAIILQECRL